MPEQIINCSECGEKIYFDYAHPVRIGKNEEIKQLLCEVCCPNCWGGTGNGPEGSQRGDARPGPSECKAQDLPVEVVIPSDLL